MSIISLNLLKLYNNYYSNLVMEYILCTSILLDPFCLIVKDLTNTSLNAYSNNINIKKSNYFSKNSICYIKKQKIQEKIPTISFIVPFSKMCKYQDTGYNPWNEILYISKSVLFCNIDNNNFYKWWNFAAIINFKWKTFGQYYYYLIWLFFTIFYLCFILAIFKENDILFIISILFGFMHLYFEFQQLLWKPSIYFKDPVNLFGK
jgi:hypothetical protein